ncbi:MAG: hypothetical protein J7494_10760 [Sphingobium sp.]|nr:hypothetical protein [Sphingobium sp.]
MKHDRLRRQNRRQADPAVIHLPSQLPPYTPPSSARETSDAMVLDGETDLLANKNIFETEPRISRQARRKALRAERKAARRAETERFLAGAPSMAEAASLLEETEATDEWSAEAPLPRSEHEAAVALLAGLLVAERPLPVMILDEDFAEEMAEPERLQEAEPEPLSDELLAEVISAAGPLIVDGLEPEVAEAAIAEVEMPEPSWLEAAPEAQAEAMIAPLPRNRALVAHRRHWLLRLVPWLSRRPTPAPEPAMAQLQELRFELVTALRKLDQIIEQTA